MAQGVFHKARRRIIILTGVALFGAALMTGMAVANLAQTMTAETQLPQLGESTYSEDFRAARAFDAYSIASHGDTTTIMAHTLEFEAGGSIAAVPEAEYEILDSTGNTVVEGYMDRADNRLFSIDVELPHGSYDVRIRGLNPAEDAPHTQWGPWCGFKVL